MSLTDEDKNWIAGLITGLESRLGARIDQLGARIDQLGARIDQLGARIDQLDARIDQLDARIERIEGRIDQLDARIEQVETDLKARIEHVETSLLTAFHRWASPAEAKMRTHNAAIHAIQLELEELADRVKRLEERKAS